MTSSHINEQVSRPKLNKNFSFSYEVNGRKTGKKGNRYEDEEKSRRDEYTTNLLYSLLNHSDIAKYRT
jgi:hypothetical protein